jgi:hypothetical protein
MGHEGVFFKTYGGCWQRNPEPGQDSFETLVLTGSGESNLTFSRSWLAAASPVNWYAITHRAAAELFLVAERTENNCAELRLLVPGEEGGFVAAPRHVDSTRVIFGPVEIGPRAPVRVALGCDALDADAVMTLTAIPRSPSPGGSVYLVGLEIDAAVRDQLAAIAALSDVHFLDTPEASELEARLADIVALEMRWRNSGGWMVWLLLAIALAGGGAAFATKRRRQVST